MMLVFRQIDGFLLGEGSVFTTNVDAGNQCLVNHKCVCGALNRHFCQAGVSGSLFLLCLFIFQIFVLRA